MPQGAYLGSITTCWEVTEDEEGNPSCQVLQNEIATNCSPNVFINGHPAAYIGSVTTHPCNVVEGSSSVLINGKGAARVGDLLSCFCENNVGVIATGSPNVIIGG
jgi:uncharacterized Zn-binding protein involved in type VI secretion